ncbi:MAG TPA: hypothetical protein VN969_24970 [Streptosporangiaceae bacterium]|nr:hypothetical protein [Streptosporangiaceae bacterium]
MTKFSQLWQFRFHGHAPPRITGWNVQNPPSAGVLVLVRSIISACACSGVMSPGPADRTIPGSAAPGPETHIAFRASSRAGSVLARWT